MFLNRCEAKKRKQEGYEKIRTPPVLLSVKKPESPVRGLRRFFEHLCNIGNIL